MNTIAALVGVIIIALDIIKWVLIIQGLLSLLIAFNVVSLRSPAVRQIAYGLERATDPLLRPIRRLLPSSGGVDFSPLVAIIIIYAIQLILPALLRDAGVLAIAGAGIVAV